MGTKIGLVVIAVILAVVATAGSALYLNTLKSEVEKGNEMVNVYVAQQKINAGTTIKELTDKGLVKSESMPRRYMVKDAMTSLDGQGDQVIGVAMSKGEQLATSKLRQAGGGTLSGRIPKGYLALSIPIDEVVGVNGEIGVGDHVTIIATSHPDSKDEGITKIILQGVEVLGIQMTSVGQKNGVNQGQAGVKTTVTVAITPGDSEKLVLGEEKGHVWLALHPAGDTTQTPTPGQSIESLWK